MKYYPVGGSSPSRGAIKFTAYRIIDPLAGISDSLVRSFPYWHIAVIKDIFFLCSATDGTFRTSSNGREIATGIPARRAPCSPVEAV
jgi:hypothetical protein